MFKLNTRQALSGLSIRPGLRLASALLLASTIVLAGCGKSDQKQAPLMFTEANGEYTVPANSPLRAHLVVRSVLLGAQIGSASVPAVVEADPTRVVNVLAPLTGRVTSVKVQFGDHVLRVQVLAVIASGDMAQAASDAQ